jgi:hypothetical protein
MKTIILLLSLAVLTLNCTSSKKTTSAKKEPVHTVTKMDLLKGGTSLENPVIIKVRNESEGVAEEYKWLAESYPGYSTIRKTQASRGNKHYDIITFKTKDGIEKNAYFDITSFYKK